MSKVRYVGFYSDPTLPDDEVIQRCTPNKPRKVIRLMNLETKEMRECELIEYGSFGDWTTLDEAEEQADEIAEDVLGDSE